MYTNYEFKELTNTCIGYFCNRQNGDSALHIAAALKRKKITSILLDAGIDCSLRNKVSVIIFFFIYYITCDDVANNKLQCCFCCQHRLIFFRHQKETAVAIGWVQSETTNYEVF